MEITDRVVDEGGHANTTGPIFVCYARADATAVGAEVDWLRERGVALWQDTHMRGGVAWTEAIGNAILGCSAVLFFVTPASARSEHCMRELVFAESRGKSVVAYHVEPTDLSAGLELMLGNRQGVMAFSMKHSEARERLLVALGSAPSDSAYEPAHANEKRRASEVLRIDIAVASSAPERALASDVAHYLTLYRGLVRTRMIEHSRPHTDATYELEIELGTEGEDTEVAWRMEEHGNGDILTTGRLREPTESFRLKRARLGELIGEAALRTIAEHQWSDAHARSAQTMGYAQLVLSADQLNYLDVERLRERILRLREAIRLSPARPQAYAALAALFAWARMNGVGRQILYDRHEMVQLISQAQKFGPSDPYVLSSLGTTHCRLGNNDWGVPLLRRALDLAPCAGTKDQLARALCFVGQPEEAARLFEEILAMLPAGHVFPHVRLALALTLSGQWDAALAEARLATTHFPQDYFGWLLLANALAITDKIEAAAEALRHVQTLLPDLNLRKMIDDIRDAYRANGERAAQLGAGLAKLEEHGRSPDQ